jgi:hypothetical protein
VREREFLNGKIKKQKKYVLGKGRGIEAMQILWNYRFYTELCI